MVHNWLNQIRMNLFKSEKKTFSSPKKQQFQTSKSCWVASPEVFVVILSESLKLVLFSNFLLKAIQSVCYTGRKNTQTKLFTTILSSDIILSIFSFFLFFIKRPFRHKVSFFWFELIAWLRQWYGSRDSAVEFWTNYSSNSVWIS